MFSINIQSNIATDSDMRTVNPQGINQDDQLHFKNFTQNSFAGHKKLPSAISWSPSGDRLVVAETSVKIWSFDLIYGCQKITESKLHDNNVDVVKFGTNNLFGTLSKESLRFWDVRQSPLKSGKLEKKNKSDFLSFCWNYTGNHVQNASEQNLKYCLLSKDNMLNLMDFRNQAKPLNTINLKNITSFQISEIGWDQTNSFFICVGGENSTGAVILLNGQNFQLIPDGIIECHCARINDFSISPKNDKIAFASDDSLVQIHQFPELICERSYSNKSDSSTRKVSFSHDGKYLAVGNQGSTIDIYNSKYGGLAHQIQTQMSSVVLQWHPKREILCYIDEKRKLGKGDKMEDTYIHILQPAI